MEVKEVVAIAKNYTTDLFVDEQISDLGLEEVEYNELSGEWLVTLGFSRPWEKIAGFWSVTQSPQQRRSYKVVRISDENGRVISVKDRGLTR